MSVPESRHYCLDNTITGEHEWLFASKNSELATAAAEIQPTDRRLRFTQEAVCLKGSTFKIKGLSYEREKRRMLLLKKHRRMQGPTFGRLLRWNQL